MAEDEWQAPEVLAMILCDHIHRDGVTGKAYLLGVFSGTVPSGFPCLLLCSIYVAFTNGRGKYRACLRFVFAETEQELARGEGEIYLPDPLAVAELDLPDLRLPLPKAGKYRLDFLCNDVLCKSRFFLAQELREGSTQ